MARSLRAEYLLTVDQGSDFCKSITSLNNLIRSIEGISITDSRTTTGSSTIEYKSLKVDYDVRYGEIPADKHRYFHIILTRESDKGLDEFDDLLRAIRKRLYTEGNKPVEVLWDDISFLYSRKAYPLIYEIENTMRKLITKFMLINVGLEWIDKAIPQEVKKLVHKNEKEGQNYLYELDFDKLSDHVLFKEYPEVDIKVLKKRIYKTREVKGLDLLELKEFIPKSNWERYFSTIVKCESDYLEKKWKRLNALRNQVAHNKFITKQEYEETKALVEDLKEKLQKALDNLDKINVPQEERKNVAENVAVNISTPFAEFLHLWKDLDEILEKLVEVDKNSEEWKRVSNSRDYTNWLLKRSKRLTPHIRKKIVDLNNFRNAIVHTDLTSNEETIRDKISSIHECIKELKVIGD